jgi:hypothetical protein
MVYNPLQKVQTAHSETSSTAPEKRLSTAWFHRLDPRRVYEKSIVRSCWPGLDSGDCLCIRSDHAGEGEYPFQFHRE